MALTILVVEDHAPFRQLTCTAFQRRAEFQTIEAADGLEAVRKARKSAAGCDSPRYQLAGDAWIDLPLHRSPGLLPTPDFSS